jgi:hypothetical protein
MLEENELYDNPFANKGFNTKKKKPTAKKITQKELDKTWGKTNVGSNEILGISKLAEAPMPKASNFKRKAKVEDDSFINDAFDYTSDALTKLKDIFISDEESDEIETSVEKGKVMVPRVDYSGEEAPVTYDAMGTPDYGYVLEEKNVYDDYIGTAKTNIAKKNKISIREVSSEDAVAEAKRLAKRERKMDLLSSKAEKVTSEYEDKMFSFSDVMESVASRALAVGGIAMPTEKEILYSAGRKIMSDELTRKPKEAVKTGISKMKLYNVGIAEAQKEITDIDSKAKANPNYVTPDIEIKRNRLLDSYNALKTARSKELESLNVKIEEAQDFSAIADVANRSYREIDVWPSRIASTLVKAVGGVAKLGKEITVGGLTKRITGDGVEAILPDFLKPVGRFIDSSTEGVENFSRNASELSDDINSSVRREIGAVEGITGGAEKFGSFAIDLFSNQVVSTAATLLAPEIGLALISAGSAGNKMTDMDIEVESTPGLKISPLKYYASGLLYGAAEYLTEKVELDQLTTLKKAYSKSFDLRDDLTNEIFTVGDALKSYGVNVNKEGSAELLSQLMQNATDKFLLDKNISLTNGLGEAYLSGAFMSGLGFQSPVLAADIYRAFSADGNANKAKSNSIEIARINKKINQTLSSEITEDSKKAISILNERKQALLDDNLKLKGETEAVIDQLSNKDKKGLLNIDSEKYELRKRIDEINENTEIDSVDKKSLIQDLGTRIKTLNDRQQRIIGNSVISKELQKVKNFDMAWNAANNSGVETVMVVENTLEKALNTARRNIEQSTASKEVKAKMLESIKEIEKSKKETEARTGKSVDISGTMLGVADGMPIAIHVIDSASVNDRRVVQHEASHRTIFNKILESGASIVEISNLLEEYMVSRYSGMKEVFAKVEKNYSGFSKNAVAEEKLVKALTTLSDRDIEKDAKFLPKLLDSFKNGFKKEISSGKFEGLNTGKDVLDLLKSFSSSFEEGELTGLIKQFAEKSIDNKTKVAGDLKFSKSIDERRDELVEKLAQDEIDVDSFDELMDELDREEEEAKNPKPKVEVKKEEKPVVDKEEADAEKIVKENKGTVASEKVQEIYDSKGVDGAFDIIKLFKPIVAKLVDKRRDAPGFDKPLLTDELETGKNGLYDLIKAYDPNSGVPLAAYINKYLPVRAIEVSRRILAKEFSKEIDEGTTSYNDSMDDDYSFDSTLDEMREEEERQSGLINPLDMMGDKLSTEYSNAVNSALGAMNEKEIASLTFAKLNDLAPEVTGKFFGIPTAKVTNAAANLATPEIAPIQKIIYDNRVKLIKLLPEGAILEGTPASESLIGTGLSIPRKIQAEFYDQKERLSKGAGLIPFELKKNITHRDFLAAFGIKEDGVGLAFGGKDPRAQTMLAMIRLYGKIASNTAVRMAAVQTLEQQADLKAGASKIQFSLEVKDDAAGYLGMDLTEDPAKVNGKNKQYVKAFNTILNSYGYKDLNTLSDSVIGRTNFKADSLINHLDAINELIKVFPNILASDIGLIKALLGLHYRTSGLSYNFIENNYKKIIDNDGNVVKDKDKLNFIINLQSPAKFNANVSKNASEISKDAKKILTDIDKELLKLPAKVRKYTSINKTKLDKIKNIILNNPTNLELIQENLDELAKFNAVNKKKAELYFENLRDWVHAKNISPVEKAKRINSLGIIFSGNANIINGVRALSAITGAVIDTTGQSTVYKVEHEDAVIKVMSSVFKSIVANEKNIEFNSTAILVPESFAVSRNKTIDVKLSNASLYQGWKAKELSLPKNSNLKELNAKFSLTTKADLEWETKFGVTSADFKVDPYTYTINIGSVKGYGIPQETNMEEAFEKIANNLELPLTYLTDNDNVKWVGFTEKNLGFKILNTGNSFEVLGIVTNALTDYIQKNKVEGIAFGVDVTEPSRVRLYKTLASTLGGKLGWKYTSVNSFNEENGIVFALTPDKNSQKQSTSDLKFSRNLKEDFNTILEETTGIGRGEEFSSITARTKGAGKGKFRFFVPPSAEDFAGLLYDFLGKGKRGEEHFEFFKTNLISPYTRGIQRIDNIRANIKEGYKALKAEYPAESKKLKKKVEGKEFTYDQAVRVYLWKANDMAVPGLSDKEVMAMSNTVKKDAKLREFADKLSIASGQLKGWVEPTEYWNVESIVSDLHNATEKVGRRNILKEFIENSDEIFSPENLNKIEAALGTNYRSALEDSLFRMKNGSNQTSTDKFSSAFVSWIANANGTIMFLNTRSAILQTIAATNYLNWTDNNPVAASAAFLNQPQYWKDFAMIFNSNKLKERREGLKADVNEAEIANAVKGSKNKAKAALSYLLKIGYTPTQIADSFAIAAGGSTFYRNRVKTYEKQGLSTKEAEDKAFEDFDNATEESQQSSDPSKLSQQQASTAGRLILAFANTPMQYNRLMKKAFRDLINGRGDAKTHVSKILYYGAVQNIVFSALQNALFATIFDDEEEDEKTAKANERKYANILNGMADTILRGTGITGAIVSTAKNVLTKFFEEREKGFKGDQAKTIVAALGISPPIGSKAAKLYSAINTEKIDKDIIDKRGMDVTLDGQLNLSPSYDIAGKVVASTTNFPLDRLVDKVNNVSEVLDSRNKTWQRVALALGWKAFDVGTLNEGEDLIRAEAKAERKEESSIESAKKRIIKKAKLQERLRDMSIEEKDQYRDSLRNVAIEKASKRKRIWEATQTTRDSIDDAMN